VELFLVGEIHQSEISSPISNDAKKRVLSQVKVNYAPCVMDSFECVYTF